MKTVQSMLAEAQAAVPMIAPDEAKALVGKADVLFLDVREPPEVAASGKVPGALAVPRGLVEFRADPASPMHDKAFDRSKTIVCYCASGGRSALVGKTLKDMGYSDVRNLGINYGEVTVDAGTGAMLISCVPVLVMAEVIWSQPPLS